MERLKILLLIIAVALPIVKIKAEDHYVPHISIGFHGGVDASRVTFSPQIGQKWQPGTTFGLSARYAEEKLVGVLAEINYTQRGWAEDFETSPLQYNRKLHYMSIPIMTHVYFGSPRCKCFFNLGPQFSFMIGQGTTANFDYHNPYEDDNWPDDPRIIHQLTEQVKNRFDYGICGGVGCEYYLRPRHSAYIEFRYYYGLGNIFPSSKADTFGASRNMTIEATLGYNFRIY